MEYELTTKQRAVLSFIKLKSRSMGYPPTVREIADYFGWESTNAAFEHLTALQRKGYIKRNRGARAITILK